jgi:hypothetical protein
VSDYFDRIEHELRLAARRRVAPVAQPRRFRLRLDGLAVGLSFGIAVLIAVFALGLRHQAPHSAGPAHHARPDLSVQLHIGPTLRDLLSNFAVLRRPPTAAEHAAVRTFTVATNNKPEVPEYVRLVGVANGIRVYFLVYPIFHHGSTGAVVAHRMSIAADGGYAYAPGAYRIFPSIIGSFGRPTAAYLGVVPDGVRAVRWRFACSAAFPGQGCRLPPERVATVTVHDNLAVLPLPALPPGTAYAGATRVTWYRTNGSQTVFTNENSAVPFAGAPPWPRLRRAARHHG